MDGIGRHVGQTGIDVTASLSRLWHQRDQRQLAQADFVDEIDGLQTTLRRALDHGINSTCDDTIALCKSLLRDWEGLWTFADDRRVPPTNNHAERMIRPGVIVRKLSGGTRTDKGARFFERTLSVCQTLRQQGRNIHQTLYDFLIAHLTLTTGPDIIPTNA